MFSIIRLLSPCRFQRTSGHGDQSRWGVGLHQALNAGEDFFFHGDHPARATEEGDGQSVFGVHTNIVQHLAVVHLHDQHAVQLFAQVIQHLFGEGCSETGRTKPMGMPSARAARTALKATRPAVRNQRRHSAHLHEVCLVADFIGTHLVPAFEDAQIGDFLNGGIKSNGRQKTGWSAFAAIRCPFGELFFTRFHWRQLGGFHHLADAAVDKDDDDRSVFLG